MSYAALLLAIMESIPALKAIYEQSVDLYFKKQAAADNDAYDKRKAARDAIVVAMMKPGVTNAEYRDLRRSLYDLRR